jgi:branched-chain amino acid transport system ATP-binding protein
LPNLEIKDLDAFYGKVQALKKVSLSVKEGECVGVIGPNGAGKTTLLECVIGLVKYNGQIEFDHFDLKKFRSHEIIKKLGIRYAPEREKIFPYMSVKDNLSVAGTGMKKSELKESLNRIFTLFPVLKQRQNQLAHTLSGGEQQMLALAMALVSPPKLLLLDEPTFGLAPYLIAAISNVINELKKRMTMLIVEQNAVFTLQHANRIYLLEHGEVVYHGLSKELEGKDYIRKTYFGL